MATARWRTRLDYEVLKSYSPLHNLEPDTCYPPVLTVVAGEDTATAPMHGHKFTAELQHRASCGSAYLVKHIPGAGHYSYGTDREERIEGEAEVVAFMARALDLDWQ